MNEDVKAAMIEGGPVDTLPGPGMRRDEICTHVGNLITKDRNNTHGNPTIQFNRAQAIKRAADYQNNPNLTKVEIEALDMICTKISRISSGKPIDDHWFDIIGYAAIAGESRTTVEEV